MKGSVIEVTGRRRRQFPTVHLPFALVLLVVVVGFQRMVADHWRQGAAMVGGALLLAALFRILLSDERAGLITIRSKRVDVLLYGGLGAVVVLVAVTIAGSRIPWFA